MSMMRPSWTVLIDQDGVRVVETDDGTVRIMGTMGSLELTPWQALIVRYALRGFVRRKGPR